MGLIEVVDAAGIPQGIGGGVLDEQGRTITERTIAEGVDALRRKLDPPTDPNLRRIVDGQGNPVEVPLELRKAPVNFMWTRDVPPAWQARLDQIFPPNDRISWLKLVWVAADEVLVRRPNGFDEVKVDAVQRWVVFQMTRQVPSSVRSFLEGPPPHPKRNQIPVMREQWDLYRDFKCYAQPYWIVQGERGGHKRRFTKHEQKLLKAQRLPTEPPEAGSKDPRWGYAPFDERVMNKLIAFDHVQFWNRAIEYDERGADQLEAEERQAAQDCRGWLLTWLESQVDAQMDSIPIGAIQTSRDVQPLDVDLERHNLITAD